jgi:uncharacterized Zn finger protein
VSDGFSGRFPRSGPPREVKGGIRARSKRGAFGRSWWARRWLAVLESLQLGGRLARGRAYARRGQVMDLSIEEGLVHARVQGSREEPYTVAIRVTPLSAGEWRRVATALRRDVSFLARLLAGEMPADIERAFEEAKLSLFPSRIRELATSCSCPDAANPCKHIAAVYYLLGEEFDRDPFLIFRLRGITRDELLRVLEELEEAAPRPGRKKRLAKDHPGPDALEGSPRDDPPNESFWRPGPLPGDLFSMPIAGQRATALLLRLGAFPFWRGPEPLPDALVPVYERAASAALEILADLTRPGGP